MVLLYSDGSPTTEISDDDLKQALVTALDKFHGKDKRKVMFVPPDFTRFHSYVESGIVTQHAYEYFGEHVKDIMPALGTHAPMTPIEISKVTGCMRAINWGHDLILSIGQVVPHEVMGMANYNKNLFVGTGGSDAINFSHFIGAVYGMERMMGRANNPLRRILNYASDHFLTHLPIVYVQTVIGRRDDGSVVTRGVYIGTDDECFTKAAALSLQVNFILLPAPLHEVVVHLDADEFKTTWLGNKSIYRTRMAIADGGTLVVLAPGVTHFGEDKQIDLLIRKYGYRTTPEVLAHIAANRDLMKNLSAAAHLIHGSPENRFRVVYACAPNGLTKEEVEGVGFEYAKLDDMLALYQIDGRQDGWNTTEGGKRSFYYVSNPAMGLWAYEGRFEASSRPSQLPHVPPAEAPVQVLTALHGNEVCVDAGVGGGPFTKADHDKYLE
ncbi:hypothetical protein DYB37_001368 [Aphanomyces astaci]|uniref:LarA-like N-terminal domain-containing protein n=1 Tax=Aphanomyces astaci TaxID=112090 RepID=A0A3R7B2N2_APHAT|nr:hypothetical protein DYB35_002856 [Aphanomyces astaci]RHZ25866.1 hypothetical protein DYB37_001368 [Aphanomyces astaci]